jgi:hypothetical protein
MVAMITSVTAVLLNSFGGRLLRGQPITGGYQAFESDPHGHPRIDAEETGG